MRITGFSGVNALYKFTFYCLFKYYRVHRGNNSIYSWENMKFLLLLSSPSITTFFNTVWLNGLVVSTLGI